MPKHACEILSDDKPSPCTLVIFGASGDLTRRKLIPALYSLFRQKRQPEPFTIVGCNLDQQLHRYRAGAWGPEAAGNRLRKLIDTP